ncbi:unnamed protein product [Agarophyton chilense]
MEGITAPPASPADANFSASKAVDKEAHGKGDKKPTHRPTPAHPAHPAPITPNSDGNSSRQAQTGSTKPVNRGKPATQSDATSKSTFDYTTGEVSVPLGASPQGVESDDERDEKDVAKLSESRQNEQGIEQRIKDQAVSHTACIKPEKAAGSMNCEPEQQSEFSRAPDQSDNLENILIGTAESKSAEHINEPVSEGRKESISALPQTETVDEAQSPSRKNETIIKGIMSSDDIGKESVLKQSSASNPDSTQHHPIQGGQGQIKDPISRNSEPTDVPLTNQEQRDTEEGDKEAGYTEIAKVHPSELEPKEEKDGSLLRSSAEKESSKVGRAGERSGNLRSRREDKPRQAMNSNICKSRELQEDPAEQKPIQSDVEEETAKHSDSSKVKKKRSTEALLTSASDQVPALESKDKEDEEKIPDQLRAYCFAYGMERRKKTEMEADMARYLSYWNRGKPGFALHEYVPTSGRVIDRDEFFGTRSSQANHSSASLGGASYSGVDVSRRMGSRMQSSYGDKGIIAGVQTHGNGSGILQTSLSTPSTGNGNRNAKTGSTATGLPRGFTTSFKQRVHARQASAKFKAAYNGAGDTIVNVVENAAAYFEGKDSPEVITDQTKSFERYQFNVDLLTEIFDGPIQEDVDILNVNLVKANGNLGETAGNNERCNNTTTTGAQGRTDVMLDIAKRLLSNKRNAHQAELDSFETNLKRAEEKAKHTERQNMRLFQKLERAETLEQVEAIKEEFEKEFGTPVDFNSRPIIRRKIDKTLPPLVIPDDQSRILRFTFL